MAHRFPTPEKEYDALQEFDLTTEKVKEIVKVFSLKQDWRSLCKLTPKATSIDLTTKLCPFFKTNCKGNQCVMFRDGKCLIVNYLEPSDSEEVPSGEGQIEEAKTSFPEWLKTATPESLAKEMLEFKNEQFPKDEEVQFHTLSNLFWSNKGVESYCLPEDIQLKVVQANSKAENQFKKEREEKRKIMCDELVKEILGNKKKYGIEGKTGKAGHTVTMKQISSILLDMGKPDILSYDLHPRINRELLRD